jgi:hypothetical protein
MSPIRLLLAGIFILMIAVTSWATAQESVVAGFWHLIEYRWNLATLADAYCGFLTFFLLVMYRERGFFKRAGLLILILLFGNIAMSAYLLYALWKIGPNAQLPDLFRPDQLVAEKK